MVHEYLASHFSEILVFIVLGVFSFIEIAPIKVNPWSRILKCIGNALNRDLSSRISVLEATAKKNTGSIADLQQKMEDSFVKEARDRDTIEAKKLRGRIISFAESCRKDAKHTRVQFEEIFRAVDDYNYYCEKYSIPNHYIDGEVKYLEEIFQEVARESKFKEERRLNHDKQSESNKRYDSTYSPFSSGSSKPCAESTWNEPSTGG